MSWNEFFNYELLHVGSKSFQVWNILLGAVVILVTILVLWFVKRLVENPRSIASQVDKKRRHSIYLIVKYFVWVISFLMFIEVLGFSVSILLGASAALLVGIGFGLQQIFADLVSGLFLLFEGIIKIGDVVQDDDGVIGKITEINLRSSEMVTRDNVIVIVPNSKFVSEKVINWSHNHDSVRFLVEIGVAYRSDVEFVISCLQEVMDENDAVESQPKSFVRFINFGDSSLDFQLIFWTKDPFLVENLKSDLRRAIHARLKKEGISIPFPQRDIHIISNPDKSGLK